jgi:ribosomal protein S18 acetylase RimI-like enzyme
MSRILAESPEAAQWLPESDPFLVAEPEAGFLVWRQVAEGEFEILNLAVGSVQRRRGIGKGLIETAMAGEGRWFLEVRASNWTARRFYEAMGFREAGRRNNYYREPVEDAILLAHHPKSEELGRSALRGFRTDPTGA